METRYGVFGGAVGNVSGLIDAMKDKVDRFILNGGFYEPTSIEDQFVLLNKALILLENSEVPYAVNAGPYDSCRIYSESLESLRKKFHHKNFFSFRDTYVDRIDGNPEYLIDGVKEESQFIEDHLLYFLPGTELRKKIELQTSHKRGFLYSSKHDSGLYMFDKLSILDASNYEELPSHEKVIADNVVAIKNIGKLDFFNNQNTVLITPTPPFFSFEDIQEGAINEEEVINFDNAKNAHLDLIYQQLIGRKINIKEKEIIPPPVRKEIKKLADVLNIDTDTSFDIERRGSRLLKEKSTQINRVVSSDYRYSGHRAQTKNDVAQPDKYYTELYLNTGQAIDGKGMIVTVKGNQMKYERVQV